MNKFNIRVGNFIKSENSTNKIMKNLIIALIPIIIFNFYKNGILVFTKTSNFYDLFKPLIIFLTAISSYILFEFLWFFITKNKKDFKKIIKESHALIPGIFLSLIIPINTPILIIIIASLFASIIGKLIYGGFGHNIFNPALIGRLFIITAYSGLIVKSGGYLNSYEQTINALSGATPLTNFANLKYLGTYETVIQPFGSIWNFIIGNIPGSLGETSALLCLIGLIYLIAKKAIKWRIPVYYISTVFIITSVIGFANNASLWYPLFQILSGGLFFGAIFMATDPVTSPITKYGNRVYGIMLGILTCIFRYLTPFPEGVLTSILLMNLLVPLINRLSIEERFNKYIKHLTVLFTVFLIFIVSMTIATTVKKANINSNDEITNLKVINEYQEDNNKIYEVKHKGFMSSDSIHAKITINNNKIINIEILDTMDHYYLTHIKNTNYINELMENQKNITSVDTISGATYTSSYLKEMVEDILKYDKKDNK